MDSVLKQLKTLNWKERLLIAPAVMIIQIVLLEVISNFVPLKLKVKNFLPILNSEL